MLPVSARISKSAVKNVMRGGKALVGDNISVRFRKNNSTHTRFGFIISKRVLTLATARNLLRRRAREILRNEIKNIKKGYDILFIFSKTGAKLSFKELGVVLLDKLKEISLYAE